MVAYGPPLISSIFLLQRAGPSLGMDYSGIGLSDCPVVGNSIMGPYQQLLTSRYLENVPVIRSLLFAVTGPRSGVGSSYTTPMILSLGKGTVQGGLIA